ncbi:MAG: hypothetical protein AVDCRST_MAG43-2049, partial [uncultured Thermomicrobiales bacterium]
ASGASGSHRVVRLFVARLLCPVQCRGPVPPELDWRHSMFV